MLVAWLKHSEREPKLRLSLVQSPGSSISTQPRPPPPPRFGKVWGPAATQAGHPVVPQAGKQARQVWGGGGRAGRQDNSGKWPSAFQRPAPRSFVNHPLATVTGGGGGARGSEALTQPSNCTWLCLHPVPSSPPHSWGKQHREETGGGVTPFPHLLQSCTCAPPTLPPVAQLSEQGELGPQFRGNRALERLREWAGLKSTISYLMGLPLSNLTTRTLCIVFSLWQTRK